MRFQLTPLGTGAALPASGRHPSALLLNVHEEWYLIDCGEGTQERLRVAGVNFMRIGHVFISHLHGDHYLGLMGLISTMHLLGRQRELHVHAPPELREIIALQLRSSKTYLRYGLVHHDVLPESGALLHADRHVEVRGLALKHRIPCTGYVFREQPGPRRLRPERVAAIPQFMRGRIKAGEDLVQEGVITPNAELTLPPPPPRSFAYCSDTAYRPELVPHLHGVDLLYHEATFTEDLAARAGETMHSTASQAAAIAKEAGVGRLLLGHFSSRYRDLNVVLREACAVWPRSELAAEGVTYNVDQRSSV